MNRLRHFIKQERGGLAVMFAIVLPFIISFCALAFDGARIMTKRARLADGLNEAALAIATAGSATPDAAEKAKLQGMLTNYINAYLPNEDIAKSVLNVDYTTDAMTGKKLPVYSIEAAVKVKTILPLDVFPAFAPTLDLSNKGKVRKGLQDLGQPADYVFVVDFSGSMDLSSGETGMSRIQLLKKVVHEITTASLTAYPETTFAIVPFNVGVPVKYNKPNAISGKTSLPFEYNSNELEGDITGCSVVMVPQKITHPKLGVGIGYDIDYDFWSYNIYGLQYLPRLNDEATSIPYTIDQVTKRLDEERYDYFNRYVIPSMTTKLGRQATWQDLVDEGWCINNGSSTLPDRAEYSCEKDHSRFIFTPENLKKITEQVHRAKRTMAKARSSGIQSIFASEIVDVESTLDGMFDEKNIITFPMRFLYTHFYGENMCEATAKQISPTGFEHLENVRHKNYLIEPTTDIDILNEFQLMEPYGNTSSSTGLLRAVPEMLKGNNPRKVMIVISDGDDNSGTNINMTHALHRDRPKGDKVCDRIIKGVKARTNAEAVDIYFISVTNEPERRDYWAQHCTGTDNAFIATNYDELIGRLVEIMSGYEETGYFYN